jgi:hypothetical protein
MLGWGCNYVRERIQNCHYLALCRKLGGILECNYVQGQARQLKVVEGALVGLPDNLYSTLKFLSKVKKEKQDFHVSDV